MIKIKSILIGIIALSVILLSGCSAPQQQTQDNNMIPQNGVNSQQENQLPGNSQPPTSQNETLATVNGEEISSKQVSKVQQSYMQQGKKISKDKALEQAIGQEVLSQKVEEVGVNVTTKEAEKMIKAQLSNKGSTLTQYKDQLEAQGMSYEDELKRVKDKLAAQKYLKNALENQEFNISEKEAKQVYEKYKQQSQKKIPPFEKIKMQIIESLKQEKKQKAQKALIEKLKSNADVKYE